MAATLAKRPAEYFRDHPGYYEEEVAGVNASAAVSLWVVNATTSAQRAKRQARWKKPRQGRMRDQTARERSLQQSL